MIIELEWKEIIDYFEHHTLSDEQKKDILSFIKDDLDWDDIMNYFSSYSLSNSEEEEILDVINHHCYDNEEFTYRLPVENLDDEQKFEIVRNLYNNLTFQELQRIEKRVKITVI